MKSTVYINTEYKNIKIKERMREGGNREETFSKRFIKV